MPVASVYRNSTQSVQKPSNGPTEEFFLDKNMSIDIKLPQIGRSDKKIGHSRMRCNGEYTTLQFGAFALCWQQ